MNSEDKLMALFSKLSSFGLEKESEEVLDILVKTAKSKKKDKCYYKVKSRYKKWPSAYASGALVKCRQVGAENWGNSDKKKKKSKKKKKTKKKASARQVRTYPRCQNNSEKYVFRFSDQSYAPENFIEYYLIKINPDKNEIEKYFEFNSLSDLNNFLKSIKDKSNRDFFDQDDPCLKDKEVIIDVRNPDSTIYKYVPEENKISLVKENMNKEGSYLKTLNKVADEKDSDEDTTEFYSVTEEESHTQEVPLTEKLKMLEDFHEMESLKHVLEGEELSPSDKIRTMYPPRFTKNLPELTEIIEHEEEIFEPDYSLIQEAIDNDSKFKFLSKKYSDICKNAYNHISRKFRLRGYDKNSCFKVDDMSPELCYTDMMHLSFFLTKFMDVKLDEEMRMSLTLQGGSMNPYSNNHENNLMVSKDNLSLTIPAMFDFLFKDRDMGIQIFNHILPYIK